MAFHRTARKALRAKRASKDDHAQYLRDMHEGEVAAKHKAERDTSQSAGWLDGYDWALEDMYSPRVGHREPC